MTGTADDSGYHDCPCRDCFEIAIGGATEQDRELGFKTGVCSVCVEAGCYADDDECSAPTAYGGEES